MHPLQIYWKWVRIVLFKLHTATCERRLTPVHSAPHRTRTSSRKMHKKTTAPRSWSLTTAHVRSAVHPQFWIPPNLRSAQYFCIKSKPLCKTTSRPHCLRACTKLHVLQYFKHFLLEKRLDCCCFFFFFKCSCTVNKALQQIFLNINVML